MYISVKVLHPIKTHAHSAFYCSSYQRDQRFYENITISFHRSHPALSSMGLDMSIFPVIEHTSLPTSHHVVPMTEESLSSCDEERKKRQNSNSRCYRLHHPRKGWMPRHSYFANFSITENPRDTDRSDTETQNLNPGRQELARNVAIAMT